MLNIWDYWYFPHLWSHCKLHTLAVDEHPTASNSSHSSYSIQSIQQHPHCGCRSSALLRALLSPCSLIVNHRELFTFKCDSDHLFLPKSQTQRIKANCILLAKCICKCNSTKIVMGKQGVIEVAWKIICWQFYTFHDLCENFLIWKYTERNHTRDVQDLVVQFWGLAGPDSFG